MEENKKGNYLTGYFIGKEFVRQVQPKVEGKDSFKVYKLLVKRNLDDQFPVKIGCPSFAKGFDLLEEGELFTVGYNLSEPIYNEKAGKEIQYKNAYFIKKATEDDLANQASSYTAKTSSAPVAPSLPSKSEVVEMYENWFDMYKEAGREHTEKDFILTFFANTQNELYMFLKDVYVEQTESDSDAE